jgi:hypothetical protein
MKTIVFAYLWLFLGMVSQVSPQENKPIDTDSWRKPNENVWRAHPEYIQLGIKKSAVIYMLGGPTAKTSVDQYLYRLSDKEVQMREGKGELWLVVDFKDDLLKGWTLLGELKKSKQGK